jgi:hypothetical protein
MVTGGRTDVEFENRLLVIGADNSVFVFIMRSMGVDDP